MAVYCNGATVVGGHNSSPISLQNQSFSRSSSSDPLNSQSLTGSSPPSSLGSRSFGFENVERGKRSDKPFFLSFDPGENIDEEFDEYLNQPEKKRRLTTDQVQFLERSFEVENKLEPERKYQLAKDLGLQPRQVAIWFQNRRARWKTKYLEKDYEALQASYNSLRADYDSLLKEKENLKDEVLHLKDMLRHGKNGNEELESSSPEQECQQPPQEPVYNSVFEGEVSKVSTVAFRQGHVIPAKSNAVNNGGQSSLLEWCDSSYVFEPDQSDLSQDEEENFGKTFLTPPASVFPVVEDTDSCYFGLPAEDHSFEFWSL